MRWEDERYVRLYTRDTVDWVSWGWEAQSVFCLLLRKVDRAGIVDTGKHGTRGLAALLGMPLEVVERGLPVLVADGVLHQAGNSLVIRNFIEAQEAKASDRARQQKARETARDVAGLVELAENGKPVTPRDAAVTTRDEMSHENSERHATSRDVTPSRAVPSLAVPSRAVPSTARESGPPAKLDITIPDINLRRMSEMQEAAFSWLKWHDEERSKRFPRALQDPPESSGFLAWYREATAAIPDARLRGAYRVYLADPWASKLPQPCPWDAWRKQWRKHVPGQSGDPPRKKPMRPIKPGESDASYEAALAEWKAANG